MKLKVESLLDKQFTPLSLVCREFRENTREEGQDLVIAIERNDGFVSAFKLRIHKDGPAFDEINFHFVERMVKALLWVKGGFKITIAGSRTVGEKIKKAYEKDGLRGFDHTFMARVYEKQIGRAHV